MPILPIGTRLDGVASAFRSGQRDAILLRQARQAERSQAALSDFLTSNPNNVFGSLSPEIAQIVSDPNIDPNTRLKLATTFSGIMNQQRVSQEPGFAERLRLQSEAKRRELESRFDLVDKLRDREVAAANVTANPAAFQQQPPTDFAPTTVPSFSNLNSAPVTTPVVTPVVTPVTTSVPPVSPPRTFANSAGSVFSSFLDRLRNSRVFTPQQNVPSQGGF